MDVAGRVLGTDAVEVEAVEVLGLDDLVPDDEFVAGGFGGGVFHDQVDKKELGVPVEEAMEI
jgi:hypothetical protein